MLRIPHELVKDIVKYEKKEKKIDAFFRNAKDLITAYNRYPLSMEYKGYVKESKTYKIRITYSYYADLNPMGIATSDPIEFPIDLEMQNTEYHFFLLHNDINNLLLKCQINFIKKSE